MKSFFQIMILTVFLSLIITNCDKSHETAENKNHTKSVGSGNKHHKAHWSYRGEGAPENWAKLDEKFVTCESGTSQSPIDITMSEKSDTLPNLTINYNPTQFDIVNNGHTVQVNYSQGSTLTLGNKKYELLQFHFHSPSEHTVNGKAYDLEMHLVHKNEVGELAVISVLFNKGAENPFIKKIWEHLPAEVNKPTKLDTELNVTEAIPEAKEYFHYTGSLTTPPCSEGVNWNIMKANLTVSEEQVTQFASLIKANARPVQPLNNRKIELK